MQLLFSIRSCSIVAKARRTGAPPRPKSRTVKETNLSWSTRLECSSLELTRQSSRLGIPLDGLHRPNRTCSPVVSWSVLLNSQPEVKIVQQWRSNSPFIFSDYPPEMARKGTRMRAQTLISSSDDPYSKSFLWSPILNFSYVYRELSRYSTARNSLSIDPSPFILCLHKSVTYYNSVNYVGRCTTSLSDDYFHQLTYRYLFFFVIRDRYIYAISLIDSFVSQVICCSQSIHQQTLWWD